MACVGTAILLCLIVFFCYKRNKKLEYKYSRLQHQAARHQRSGGSGNNSSSSFLGSSGSASTAQLVAGQHQDHEDSGDVDCETEMAAAESCAIDEDDEDEDEDQVSVTVPIKSFGLVNKIRSMTTAKVSVEGGEALGCCR